MPYIPNKDYARFDPPIDAIVETMVNLARNDKAKALSLFFVVAAQVADLVMPERRYYAFALTRGILHDAADEMKARFEFPSVDYNHFPEYHPRELLAPISDLVVAIKKCAAEYQEESLKKDQRKSYDGAYAGLTNYSLTSVALRLALALYSPAAFRRDDAGYEFLSKIPAIFYKASEAFYRIRVRKYEDEQIAKSEDGDLKEYVILRNYMNLD